MSPRPPRVEGYAIERLLGTERSGNTWQATAADGTAVVLGEIECGSLSAATRIDDDPEVQRLTTVMVGISHSGIAETLEVFACDTSVLIAQVLPEHASLDGLLAQQTALPVREAWATACQLLIALEFGHLRGLLHLGLRPCAVHYDREQQHAILTGFGHTQLALMLRPDIALTDLADEYAAPEIHLGAAPTPAAEVFSVGTLLHQMLTGLLPDRPDLRRPEGGGRFSFLEVGREEAERDPEEILRELAQAWPALVSVLTHSLQHDPARRYQRAPRMQSALASAYRADAYDGEYVERDAPGAAVEEELAERERDFEEERRPRRVEGGIEFCEKCGRPLTPGSRVCQSCGTPPSRRGPAITLPPQRREPTTYFQRQGDRLLAEERFEDAEEAYRMAARRAPDDPQAQRDLGDLALINGHHEEAERAYREVLRTDPDNLETRHELGRALAGRGRHRQAIYELRKVLASDPPDALRLSALTHAGASLAARGQHREARAAWGEVIEEDPGNAHVHYCIALSWLSERNDARAAAALREALRADPDFGEAREQLRRVNQRLQYRDTQPPGLFDDDDTGPRLPIALELFRFAVNGGRTLLRRRRADEQAEDADASDDLLEDELPGRRVPVEDGDEPEDDDRPADGERKIET